MKRAGIAVQIYGIVGAVVLGLAAVCALNAVLASRLQATAARLSTVNLDSLKSLQAITQATARQTKLVSRSPGQLQAAQVKTDQAEFGKLAGEVEQFLSRLAPQCTDPEMRQSLDATRQKLPAFCASAEIIFQRAADFQQQEALEALAKEFFPVQEDLVGFQTKLTDRAMALTAREPGVIQTQARHSIWAGIGVSAVVVLGAVTGSLWLVRRRILPPLLATANSLVQTSALTASATAQVSQASHSLAEGASQQAASLEETSASIEELSSMTRRNLDSAQRGKTLGAEAHQSADTGRRQLDAMNLTLNAIKTAVGEMESAVREIQTSSQEIAKIIKTIDEIAFQTNLLALNAAVEAARAGEAGAGFAVVADEVRALAQRSAQAARDTSEQIAAAVKRSELGSVTSQKVAASLGEVESTARGLEEVFQGIARQITALDEVTTQIVSASQEQNSGLSEVNGAVGQIDKVTQSNAASAEENAAAAEQLTGQTTTLQQIVTQLQCVVMGQTSAASRLAASRSAPTSSRPGARDHRNQAISLAAAGAPLPQPQLQEF
jgi:methyl-accepting chemotaxis protein